MTIALISLQSLCMHTNYSTGMKTNFITGVIMFESALNENLQYGLNVIKLCFFTELFQSMGSSINDLLSCSFLSITAYNILRKGIDCSLLQYHILIRCNIFSRLYLGVGVCCVLQKRNPMFVHFFFNFVNIIIFSPFTCLKQMNRTCSFK